MKRLFLILAISGLYAGCANTSSVQDKNIEQNTLDIQFKTQTYQTSIDSQQVDLLISGLMPLQTYRLAIIDKHCQSININQHKNELLEVASDPSGNILGFFPLGSIQNHKSVVVIDEQKGLEFCQSVNA